MVCDVNIMDEEEMMMKHDVGSGWCYISRCVHDCFNFYFAPCHWFIPVQLATHVCDANCHRRTFSWPRLTFCYVFMNFWFLWFVIGKVVHTYMWQSIGARACGHRALMHVHHQLKFSGLSHSCILWHQILRADNLLSLSTGNERLLTFPFYQISNLGGLPQIGGGKGCIYPSFLADTLWVEVKIDTWKLNQFFASPIRYCDIIIAAIHSTITSISWLVYNYYYDAPIEVENSPFILSTVNELRIIAKRHVTKFVNWFMNYNYSIIIIELFKSSNLPVRIWKTRTLFDLLAPGAAADYWH